MNHRFPVSDLLVTDDVAPTTHQFEVPAGSYDDLVCTTPLVGEVRWQPLSPTEILGSVTVATTLELTCDRCLATFTRPVQLAYDQLFTTEDVGDPATRIDDQGVIDLLPSLTQELKVALPMKIICRPDCPGIIVTS